MRPWDGKVVVEVKPQPQPNCDDCKDTGEVEKDDGPHTCHCDSGYAALFEGFAGDYARVMFPQQYQEYLARKAVRQ